jgi:hypothetical protein
MIVSGRRAMKAAMAGFSSKNWVAWYGLQKNPANVNIYRVFHFTGFFADAEFHQFLSESFCETFYARPG